MAQFRYRAVSASGELLRGEMQAASADEVITRLQDQGHVALDAQPAGAATGLGQWLRRGPLDAAALAQFTLQLGTLLHAGQPLDRALSLLAELPEGAQARHLIERLRERVRGGAALSQALEDEHGAFSRLYVSLVRAGEASGRTDEALLRLAEHLERTAELRGAVINALVYPAFLLVGVFGALVLLLTYVVPQFVPIFASMDVPLPWITRAVLALGDGLRHWGWLLLVALIAAGFGLAARLRDPAQRLAFDVRLLRVPVLGSLLLKIETARMARTLGTLLGNGVPLLAALTISRQVAGNRALDAALGEAIEAVKQGLGLSAALAPTQRLPRLALAMMQVGEESGTLEAMLLRVADTFDTETRRSVDRLLAALVPVLTVVMTVLVGLIMLAILLPLLSLTSGIQ